MVLSQVNRKLEGMKIWMGGSMSLRITKGVIAMVSAMKCVKVDGLAPKVVVMAVVVKEPCPR